ncbi:TetR/AcrR family transcriptional regulator [Streptomonospora nanhaiensis]|uniref:AcrR family transcriptional regulator n=1 Tax=Streptomonospora nanhaiensis TaxID=1323731 RepID=A0A853BHJ6_9ACTN|nr:TetR/AcrR family transcriptional regulator [Streptomonospora nanhaiensis]MBV2364408.1 TetR/AcrR family transcriptional regulator [Streptomonospora nanhaiensis]MBX9388448.1 TetR/AcrR family transcriptional regulator [Streptomonospora nanhaiensis]NYI94037.1 AcrR family transcriptional regulator [Streptomonospora nanhaiensis]
MDGAARIPTGSPHTDRAARPVRRGRPSGRTAQGDSVRERILAAATRHFAAAGYHGSSLARIAADCGLSQPGLLHHFPSKRRLLEELLAERDRRDVLAVGGWAGQSGAAVLDFVRRLVAHNARQPDVVRAFAVLSGEAVGTDHPARDYFAERYRTGVAAMAAGLRRGVEAGELRADLDCAAVAAEVLAVMDGMQTQWLLAPEDYDMAAAFGAYADRLRAAIAAPARAGG